MWKHVMKSCGLTRPKLALNSFVTISVRQPPPWLLPHLRRMAHDELHGSCSIKGSMKLAWYNKLTGMANTTLRDQETNSPVYSCSAIKTALFETFQYCRDNYFALNFNTVYSTKTITLYHNNIIILDFCCYL